MRASQCIVKKRYDRQITSISHITASCDEQCFPQPFLKSPDWMPTQLNLTKRKHEKPLDCTSKSARVRFPCASPYIPLHFTDQPNQVQNGVSNEFMQTDIFLHQMQSPWKSRSLLETYEFAQTTSSSANPTPCLESLLFWPGYRQAPTSHPRNRFQARALSSKSPWSWQSSMRKRARAHTHNYYIFTHSRTRVPLMQKGVSTCSSPIITVNKLSIFCERSRSVL